MDFDKMTKEELINVLEKYYSKLIKPIPDRPLFIVGRYYALILEDDDMLTVFAGCNAEDYDEKKHIVYLTIKQGDEYFEQ